jgi:hypothetical protein
MLVTGFYNTNNLINGILKVEARYTVGSTAPEFINLRWLMANSSVTPANFIVTHKLSSNTVTLNLYVYLPGSWSSMNFTKLSEHNWGGSDGQFGWTFLQATSGSAHILNAIPSGETKVESVLTDIKNNASSATKFYATRSVAASTQYFIPFVSGSSSGNKDAYFHPRVYLWDTGSRMHLCVGEQGTSTSDATGAYSGGLTINSGSGKGKYVDIIPAAMTGHRTITIPDASGTICLTNHNHDSTYLKLSGGTMAGNITLKNTGNTVNAHILRSGISQSWYQGRNSAMIKTTSYTGYDAILSMKTTAGDWSLGVYSDNKLYFTYILDSNYNANTNTATAQIRFDPDGTVVAPKFSGSLSGNATSANQASLLVGSATKLTSTTVDSALTSTAPSLKINVGDNSIYNNNDGLILTASWSSAYGA